MAGYTLYLCTYDRGLHPVTGKVQPYHWAFFIQIHIAKKKNVGVVHQLRGMPGGFHYDGAENVADLWKSKTLKLEIPIGVVNDADIDRIEAIFQSIPIDTSEWSGWNCQSWSLDGFERLQQGGFIDDTITREGIYEWLKEPDDMLASEDPIPGDEVIATDLSYDASTGVDDGGKEAGAKAHSSAKGKGKKTSHHAGSSASGSSSVQKDNKKKKKPSGPGDEGKKASHHSSVSPQASSATDNGLDLDLGSLSIQGNTPWCDGWYEDPWTDGTGTTQRYFGDGAWTDLTR